MKPAREPASSRPKPCASLKKSHKSYPFAAPSSTICSDTLPWIIRDSKELSECQRKEDGQISVQLNAYKMKKNDLTLPT